MRSVTDCGAPGVAAAAGHPAPLVVYPNAGDFGYFLSLLDTAPASKNTVHLVEAARRALGRARVWRDQGWGCGLGGGYLLAFNPLHWFDNATLGAAGYWIANTAGTLLIATALLAYLLTIQRRYRHLHTH